MEAKTVWPACANARAVRLPKPLDAPVIRTTRLRSSPSDHAAVDADNLAIDPTPVRPGQEGDHGSGVVRLTQAAERGSLGNGVDRLFAFVVEEKACRRRTGCHGIDRDPTRPELLRKDVGQRFDAGLGRGVDAVGGLIQADDARGEVYDTAAGAKPARNVFKVPFRLMAIRRSTRPSSLSAK